MLVALLCFHNVFLYLWFSVCTFPFSHYFAPFYYAICNTTILYHTICCIIIYNHLFIIKVLDFSITILCFKQQMIDPCDAMDCVLCEKNEKSVLPPVMF